MADFLSAYSIQRWLESCPQGYLENTAYGHEKGEREPDLLLEEDYENTNGFRFGLDWMASEKINVRGGYLWHQGAAPDQTVTPLLPEGNRNEFTAGLGIRLGRSWMVDLAYQYIRQDKRRGRVRDAFPGTSPTVALNSGLYTFNAHLLAATVAVNF